MRAGLMRKFVFFFSSRRRHTRSKRDWSSDVCSSDLIANKKIEDLIRWFHAYHTVFNPRSRLLLVGAQSQFERYAAALHHLVATLGTPHVHFIGHVSDEELVAFFEVADLFLCASEH